MDPHAVKEGNNVIYGSRCDEFPVIEPKAYPEVIHEYGEARHHGCDAPRATELVSGGNACKRRSRRRYHCSRLVLIQHQVDFASILCGGRERSSKLLPFDLSLK